MKVRRLDKDGDMMLGRGSSCFLENSAEAVAQNVMTRLQLWRGTWFIDTDEGTPWLQQVLGKRDVAESVIRARVLGTEGVVSIESFESVFDPDARALTVQIKINTVYGEADITESF